jgi:hypothetical protein
MDYKRREEIFSKEALSIKDVSELFGCSTSTACRMIKNWRRKLIYQDKDLRIEVSGKIHILDYMDVMGIEQIDNRDRYPNTKKPVLQLNETARKSVCL